MSAVLDEEEEETEEQRYQRFCDGREQHGRQRRRGGSGHHGYLAIESEASALLARLIGEVLAEAKPLGYLRRRLLQFPQSGPRARTCWPRARKLDAVRRAGRASLSTNFAPPPPSGAGAAASCRARKSAEARARPALRRPEAAC